MSKLLLDKEEKVIQLPGVYVKILYHTSNAQNYTIAKRESNLSITTMITNIRWQEVLLPINHNRCNFRTQQIHLGQISPLETILKVKKISRNSLDFFMISGCCYGYCDNYVIDGFGWVDLI